MFSCELLPAASFDFSRVRSLVNGEVKFIPRGDVSAISISDIIERRTRFECRDGRLQIAHPALVLFRVPWFVGECVVFL